MAATDAATDPVALQYEHYPYPQRDPGDEAKRLIEGSPSHPVEIDHMLFGGARDWSRPFSALVAGGGTGDGLIMLAQKLADIGCPAEITYVDLSRASRRIAEARAKARGLTSIRFVTGSSSRLRALAGSTTSTAAVCCITSRTRRRGCGRWRARSPPAAASA